MRRCLSCVASSLTFSLLLLLFVCVKGEFGDYVDPTYNCPATTTCTRVCVPTEADCPPEMTCPLGETLCVDGSCSSTTCDPDLERACEFDCAPVSCVKLVTIYSDCLDKYTPFYDAETECGEIELAAETDLLQFNEPGFVVIYIWVSVLTASIFLWCAFNQKIAPVSGSTQTLKVNANVAGSQDDSDGTALCQQTGYKVHPVGAFLHVSTILTFLGWNVILAWLTIQYYTLNEAKQLDKRNIHIEDEEQLLKAFIIAWNVSFVWCFLMKWPFSIETLFLRRCTLAEATHVAVYLSLPTREEPALSSSYLNTAKQVTDKVLLSINNVCAFLFSDSSAGLRRSGIYQYCEVRENQGVRFFVFSFRRYNFEEKDQCFMPGYCSGGKTLAEIAKAGLGSGLSAQEVNERLMTVGPNTIEMIKPTFLGTLYNEITKPFYIYQLYLVWVWMPIYFYYMAIVLGFVVTISALFVTYFHFRNLSNLFKITHIYGTTEVMREGAMTVVANTDIVPGDLVCLRPGTIYSDMVIVKGETILVDESALTGEATPQVKTPIEALAVAYDKDLHKRHTLSSGTTLLEAEDALAVVLHTASYTSKGELLRDIFSYRRHSFKFDSEIAIVIFILFLYAVFSFTVTVKFIEDSTVYGWFYGMYVVATVLPALLPTVFTVSVGVSDKRLSDKKVATANSESILIAGKVSKAFFDKTGTLTKQGLDFVSANSAVDWGKGSISADLSLAMACCHSLARSQTGMLVGNNVDRVMFESSGATMESSNIMVANHVGKATRIEVLRHFDFDHRRMTQSVIARLPDGKLVAFVKGSGESIGAACIADTLPNDFYDFVQASAASGTYQISVASKQLEASTDVEHIARDEVESKLNFVGVLNFSNVLRPDTPSVISHLQEGEVQCIMVTGDNVCTGVRIAKECGIMLPDALTVIGSTLESNDMDIVWIDEHGKQVGRPSMEDLEQGIVQLALTGKAWYLLTQDDPKEAQRLAPMVRVFGRCTPRDKVSVVDAFVELGFVTLMCGDGGNDCGALKAAHVGVALSDAEASIVAPFSSLDKEISSVVEVLKEGRCALASAVASYKFIVMYGQVETVNQILNAYFQITFYEWNWVFMDGLWTMLFALALPQAGPASKLAKTRPTSSILGPHTLSSVLGVFGLNLMFTLLAITILFQQDWFQCRKWNYNDVSDVTAIGDNYESSVIFLVSGFQYIISAWVFGFGHEFRQAWYRNYVMDFLLVVYTFIHLYITLIPGKLSCLFRVNCTNEDVVKGVTNDVLPILNPFNTTVMPVDFRWKIFVIMIVNALTIALYEYFIVNGIRHRVAGKRLILKNEGSIPLQGQAIGVDGTVQDNTTDESGTVKIS